MSPILRMDSLLVYQNKYSYNTIKHDIDKDDVVTKMKKASMIGQQHYSDSSLLSELVSSYIISKKFKAFGYDVSFDKAEGEIIYNCQCKRTDYTLQFKDKDSKYRLAVEVKRISTYNNKIIVNRDYISKVINKANIGAIESNRNVSNLNQWDFQILHIITNIDPNMIFNYINDWKDNINCLGFAMIVISYIDGNCDIIFNK
jgi:hypothetical protein